MNNKLYSLSKEVIIKSEIVLGDLKISPIQNKTKFNWHFDVLLPMKFFVIGGKDFFAPLLKAIILFSIIISCIFAYEYTVGNIVDKVYLISIFLMLIPFAIPSRYAFSGIENQHVEKIILIFKYLNITTNKEIELIEKDIEIVYNRTIERINALKWIVGVFSVTYGFYLKTIYDFNKDNNIITLHHFLQENINMLFVVLAIIMFITIYKRGVDFLFKTIKFAINDYKLLINCNTQTKPLSNSFLKVK